jgi:hypothetical protein
MAFIDVISALVIFGFFISGFSQAFLPAYNAWDNAAKEYRTAQTINFIAESFKQECSKQNRNIDNWKNAVATVKELNSYEITELWQGEILRALKLTCIISGEYLEIIGVCTQ